MNSDHKYQKHFNPPNSAPIYQNATFTTPPPHQLYSTDVTPLQPPNYFQSPNSDLSPLFAQTTHMFSAPSSATNSNFYISQHNEPINPNFSPLNHDTSWNLDDSQPLMPVPENSSIYTTDQPKLENSIYTTDQPKFGLHFEENTSDSVGLGVYMDQTQPSHVTTSHANNSLSPSIDSRAVSNPYDSPTTIEVSSPRSSIHNISGVLDGDLSADDILNIDPFEVIHLDSRRASNDIVSSLGNFEIGTEKFYDALPNYFPIENNQNPPPNQNQSQSQNASHTQLSSSSAPPLKKLASSAKINKKTLRKSRSFNGHPTDTISSISVKQDPHKKTKPPASISFSECSQRFSISSIHSNKFSFVYENAGNIANDIEPYELKKSQLSASVRNLGRTPNLLYDNDCSLSVTSPKLLRNMKAGMVEFQVNLNK